MKAVNHRPEVRLKGIAAAPGVARGPVYPLMRGMAIVACEKVADPEAEIGRLEGALAATRREISQLRDDVARKLNESERSAAAEEKARLEAEKVAAAQALAAEKAAADKEAAGSPPA